MRELSPNELYLVAGGPPENPRHRHHRRHRRFSVMVAKALATRAHEYHTSTTIKISEHYFMFLAHVMFSRRGLFFSRVRPCI